MDASEIPSLDLCDVADRIAEGELSSREVTATLLDRIEQLDPRYGAYIEVHAESALLAADAADRYLVAGYRLGPLHGVPIALKDLIWEQGRHSRAGSRVLADFVPAQDATVTQRLRRSGAIFLGRLNMHEFAYGITTVNPHYGTTRNPWDSTRSVGGSSGGSGAALAAGFCFGALGTDTGCSIRLPAAFTGVVGLRPTIGRISLHGVEPLAPTLDTVGPLARTVADCARLYAEIAGADPRDPRTTDVAVVPADLDRVSDLRGVRIGLLDDLDAPGADGPVVAAIAAAVEVLRTLGASVETVHVPDLGHRLSALLTLNRAEPSAYHGEIMRGPDGAAYGADTRRKLEIGEFATATHYIQAQRYRELLRRRFAEAFEGDGVGGAVDAFLVPSVGFEAPPIGATEIVDGDGSPVDVAAGSLTFNAIAPLTGGPALALPCGFGPTGLPLGMQLIGPAFSEHRLLRIGHAYEQAAGWTAHRAPCDP